MTALQSIGILLTIAALSSWINHRYLKLSSAIGVMVVSLIFSVALIILEQVDLVNIDHLTSLVKSLDFEGLLLHGMLAFLLFAGGLTVNLRDLASQRGPVALLSTLGVALSTLGTGALYWLSLKLIGIDIPFIFALLFGAIVSPTDAVAVLGILRKAGAPKSLETKVVGESLFNDGVGVVVFLTIAALTRGDQLSPNTIALTLLLEIVGGIGVGAALGWVTFLMLKAVDDYVVEILITLALAAGGYALAELLHVSAPICAVVSGLIVGNPGRQRAMTERTVEHLDTFWELVDEFLNVILFVLIGLEVLALSIGAEYIAAGLLGICAALLARFVSVWLPIIAIPKERASSTQTVRILAWGGLKGGISVALALSSPPSDYHDLILVSTYLVVLFSVIVQGTTLPLLLRHCASEEAAAQSTLGNNSTSGEQRSCCSTRAK